MRRTTRASSRSATTSSALPPQQPPTPLCDSSPSRLTTPRKQIINSASTNTSAINFANMLKTPNKRFRDEVKRKKLAVQKDTNIMSGKYGSVIILSKENEKNNEQSNADSESGGERTPTPRTPLKNIDPNVLFSPSNATSNALNSLFSPSFKTPNIAVKSQQIVKKQENCTPIREFKIQKELTKMRVGKLNLFPNVFSSFSSTTCPEDDLYDDETDSEEEEMEQPKRKKKQTSCPHYFNIMMEKCDGGIVDLIQENSINGKVSLSFAKSIAFQLIFALAIAESIGFQHNDMHERNVLYKKLPKSDKKGIAFFEKIEQDEYIWLIECNFMLKIADYGLSRIQKEDGEEIESGNIFHSNAFNSDLDRVKEILTKRIKLDSSTSTKEDTKLFSDLKRSIKSSSGTSAKDLLLHEFFDSLRLDDESKINNDHQLVTDYHTYYGAKHEKRRV
ncbi:predicted protein [Naegleria gruberi]|uniref:Predicted protein n=1 Tax=Naegleria gruberi TaxID=5762 RepID=D2V0J5_NAEGR|nr:uncharacterized protein NAEGRDRAFT_45713 [Naegleria gruberi]EFC49734.1 predicted protein [Naegleria gruberi]|eukprot:XP_002682478.1 predicted protein [Naegleria gruberi strain NEG-M]